MTEPNSHLAPPDTIEVVAALPPGTRWQPVVGAETLSLQQSLTGLTDDERARLIAEAVAVLARCEPPTAPGTVDTGLVVGYVQSGKTMSFTAVAALARDNGFPLVIIITGTSIPLSSQSVERLTRDLRLDTRPDRKWQHFNNPRRTDIPTIAGTLADWCDPSVPDADRQTVLLTVMKNHTHLRHLAAVLEGLDLRQIPALVIDDEADQAGLNNLVNQRQESTTYRRLVQIRAALPKHAYLQYTATPQAPLLINLIDILSPGFAEVLTPGAAYVGGQDFFVEHPELVRIIPAANIPTAANPLAEPPSSLLEGMRVFMLGVAAGLCTADTSGNRSMMVHPSQHTLRHAEYVRWVREAKQLWERVLGLPDGDPDRQDLVAEFRDAYDDLHRTVPDLPDVDTLMHALPRALRRTEVTEVNAVRGRTPEINWRGTYGHILVGGQAMDRGFTVRGLTVTYMPRGVGVGTADTVQQRARFLGYKQAYLGLCRVYLETQAQTAYRRYVDHEEDIRSRLLEHKRTGQSLMEWKRAFFLSAALQPTRRSVMDLNYMQGLIEDEWYAPRAPHDSEEAIAWNRNLVDGFLGRLEFQPDDGHADRRPFHRHLVAPDVPLSAVFSDLLTKLRITRGTDSQPFVGLLLQIGELLGREPDANCTVYRISPGAARTRGLNIDDEIPNLFQGAYPVEPVALRGSIYPGDRLIRADEGLTIQVHYLEILDSSGQTLYQRVPVVAVWVPRGLCRRTWLVQEEPR